MGISGAETTEAAAEPTEAVNKIITIIQIVVNKTRTRTKIIKIKILLTPSPTRRAPDMLMGPQIARAAAIGPKVEGLPTAPIPSSAAGPPSLPPDSLKIIERLAC